VKRIVARFFSRFSRSGWGRAGKRPRQHRDPPFELGHDVRSRAGRQSSRSAKKRVEMVQTLNLPRLISVDLGRTGLGLEPKGIEPLSGP
jgi:hypothetical protein